MITYIVKYNITCDHKYSCEREMETDREAILNSHNLPKLIAHGHACKHTHTHARTHTHTDGTWRVAGEIWKGLQTVQLNLHTKSQVYLYSHMCRQARERWRSWSCGSWRRITSSWTPVSASSAKTRTQHWPQVGVGFGVCFSFFLPFFFFFQRLILWTG